MTLSRYAAVLATGPVDQVHMTYLRKMDPPPPAHLADLQ